MLYRLPENIQVYLHQAKQVQNKHIYLGSKWLIILAIMALHKAYLKSLCVFDPSIHWFPVDYTPVCNS